MKLKYCKNINDLIKVLIINKKIWLHVLLICLTFIPFIISLSLMLQTIIYIINPDIYKWEYIDILSIVLSFFMAQL